MVKLRLLRALKPEEDPMTYLRRLVVVLLLAVWSFPATGLARSESKGNQAQSGRSSPSAVDLNGRPGLAATPSEAQQYSEREKQSKDLEQFEGGSAVYISGGVVTVLLLVIIILLLI